MEQTIHPFQKESAFELALCDVLTQHGWEKDILVQPSEEDLVENWAKIIFGNNQELERLGNYPLTASEMQQIIDQVNTWHSPYEINKQINGCYVCIKRDNPQDTHNVGIDNPVSGQRIRWQVTVVAMYCCSSMACHYFISN